MCVEWGNESITYQPGLEIAVSSSHEKQRALCILIPNLSVRCSAYLPSFSLDLFLYFHCQTWKRFPLDLTPVFGSPDPYLLPCPLPLVLLCPLTDRGDTSCLAPAHPILQGLSSACFKQDPWHRPGSDLSPYFISLLPKLNFSPHPFHHCGIQCSTILDKDHNLLWSSLDMAFPLNEW